MNQEFLLDPALARSVSEVVSDLGSSDRKAAAALLAKLEKAIALAIAGHNECRREAVAHLAAVLVHAPDTARPEMRIRLLAEACFYFNRIGRAYDGLEAGTKARDLARTGGLKNLERFAATALGIAYVDGACFEEACVTLERTLVLARELGEPEFECLALSNTAMLLKEMGLYQDAIEVTDKALAFDLTSPRGRMMALNNASHGLFSAHRLRDEAAALRYLRIGSAALDDNPLADAVHKAAFEYFRAMYLLANDDHETADVLIKAARRRAASVRNTRVEILLDLAGALCDWASRDPQRERQARKRLIELYHTSKQAGVNHDDVLRALVEVHKRTLTGETIDLDRRHATHSEDVMSGLNALSRIVTETAKTGLEFAKELILHNTGAQAAATASSGTDPNPLGYTAGVKNAKFYRQMHDRGAALRPRGTGAYDPFRGARAWLGDGEPPATIANIGNPGVGVASSLDAPTQLHRHDELSAIHGDMALLRIVSLKAAMRTAAYDVAENWALAAEFFDDQTGEHCFRVGRLAGLLAAELGIDAENCLRIEHAARLHDIGKIAVNELILMKPGPLDSNEIVAMRAHTEVGAHLLEQSDDATLRMAAGIARYHHAWWNGAGYPDASGESIPLAARICAYADVYDALTNERPYKRAWPHRLAVEQMLCESGAHFDPRLMAPFLKVLERHVGSNAGIPSTRVHLQEMEASGLLTSRRNLMKTVQAG